MLHPDRQVLRHDGQRIGRLKRGRQHAVVGNQQGDITRSAALAQPRLDDPVGGIRYVDDDMTVADEFVRTWRSAAGAASPPYADHAFHIHAAGTQQMMEGPKMAQHQIRVVDFDLMQGIALAQR